MDDDGWTPSETLLLLEGIELFGEEWVAVAEHVRGKLPVRGALQQRSPCRCWRLRGGGLGGCRGGGGVG